MAMCLREEKEEFSNDVINIVRELCKTIFNVNSEDELENLFGIKYGPMEDVIQRFVFALPDNLFSPLQVKNQEELKTICAREFIFFQVQERWGDPEYDDNLKNFIKLFSRDMQNKF